jgi:tRNA-2-methylthio-N6-dimethylallyladenosine synthase
MNVRDSEALAALLSQRGHQQVFREEDAEALIVNTCSVRGKAEEKAIGKLRLLVRDKKNMPGRKVGAVGCMVQRLQNAIFEEVPGLDFALGTRMLDGMPDVFDSLEAGKVEILKVDESINRKQVVKSHLDRGPAAFVNVMLGCNMNCTYCIVPSVRGREWSRPGNDVVDEVRALAERGVREVTLLGQSVMSYGRVNRVWPENYQSAHGWRAPFPRLLEAVAAVDGIERVRFTSGHPSGCSVELCEAVAALPEVCEHLHLPLQSGSDRILKLMQRGYTAGKYLEAVSRLKSRNPGIAVTTDIIVGFPSEKERDFRKTRELMEEIEFDNAFIFKYSPRPGTGAAGLDDDVTEQEKMMRNKILLADQDRRVKKINRGLVEKKVEVLVEGVSKRNSDRWSGRTRTNKVAVFDNWPGHRDGEIVQMRVDKVTASALYCSCCADAGQQLCVAAGETGGSE